MEGLILPICALPHLRSPNGTAEMTGTSGQQLWTMLRRFLLVSMELDLQRDAGDETS